MCGAVDKSSHLGTRVEQGPSQITSESGADFSAWKRVKGSSSGGLRKQTLTLGVGVGQLSSSIQGESSVLMSQSVTSKNEPSHVNEPSPAGNPGHIVTSSKIVESSSVTSQSAATKQGAGLDAVYIQCVDASGKVYLIPQQMLKTSSAVEKKQGLKPLNSSPGKKDVLKTTVVGSGPNKATLTYMLSSQVSKATKPLLTPALKVAPSGPIGHCLLDLGSTMVVHDLK